MSMLTDLLGFAATQGASDVHLSSGVPPLLRLNGDMRGLTTPALAAAEVDAMIRDTMRAEEAKRFDDTHDVDYVFDIPDGVRCRANAFLATRGPSAVFHLIKPGQHTLASLGIPAAATQILEMDRGLVLVTGPAGSGKSTTLSALVNAIAETKAAHILTIEDPVEFVHKGDLALVNHRELGTSTPSFARALKSALREDPDVIVIGEMRDLETIQLAITAAETGHLVIGTLHTSSAPKTITRIIDVFPPDKQEQVRTMLAESLQMVLSQVLVKRTDGQGRVAAFELLLASTAIKNQIRENQIFQITGSIEISTSLGMQTLEQSLRSKVKEGVITAEEAAKFADPDVASSE